MSQYITPDEIESKFSLVIRKPQEGKTFICITNINKDMTKNIHIVMTMNTLCAGMQFFGRMEEIIGSENIIVFNSDRKTAGRCHHAKTVCDIIKLIRKYPDIKVIVCCAHQVRIRDSVPELFTQLTDSSFYTTFNRCFNIHIDEAHKYIPENKPTIRQYNSMSIVNSIIGYSGSPDGIWSDSSSDTLFHKILIRDVNAELEIIKSPSYFGVDRCEFIISREDITNEELIIAAGISPEIPNVVISRAGMTENKIKNYFGDRSYFDLGNEILLLSYMDYILPKMEIAQDRFSYNFTPAYTRKCTQYAFVELILKHYSNANVIVINANGYELYRINTNTQKSNKVKTNHQVQNILEPSAMIQELICDYDNCPTFVTGFICVGMSVTLVDKSIGNFDNVVMAHQQYSRDKLYQLCRFLFNYISWPQESIDKIKHTKFYSLTQHVVDTCREYEDSVENMCDNFAGQTCSLNEIQGREPEEPTHCELKKAALHNIQLESDKLWKMFKVFDGNEEEEWKKAEEFYQTHMKKTLSNRSRPKKHVDGLYHCSTTANVEKKTTNEIHQLNKHSWYSLFQLKPECLVYSRVFVGYEHFDDPSQYTIYIKYVTLVDNESTRATLIQYGKKIRTAANDDAASDAINDDDT